MLCRDLIRSVPPVAAPDSINSIEYYNIRKMKAIQLK